jgi:RecA-family ATPase
VEGPRPQREIRDLAAWAAQLPADANAQAEAVAIVASDVIMRPITWLWDYYIPLGKFSLLDGDPGTAKTTLALDLGARITRGREMPDDSRALAESALGIFISYEDDASDTLVPRFKAAGGDLDKLIILTVSDQHGVERPISIPEDVGLLEATIIEHGAKLVVIDPLVASFSPEFHSHNDAEMRRALALLRNVAEGTGASIVGIRHLKKNEKLSNTMYRGGGSIGIIGAARAGLIVARDTREDGDPNGRVLSIQKSNLAAARLTPPQYFRVKDEVVSLSGELEQGYGRIEWDGEFVGNVDDLLPEPTFKTGSSYQPPTGRAHVD